MRVTEIARLEVHHVLSQAGVRREEISLPGSITKGCHPHCVYLSHPMEIEAFERYVTWRHTRQAAVSHNYREFRGLVPRTGLILTQKAGPFELSV